MCPNDSLYRWWTTQWTLDWLGVTPDNTNPFSFCISQRLTFVNVYYFLTSGNVSLQYKIFSWEKSVPNTNRIIMVTRLADLLFGRYRMGLGSSSLERYCWASARSEIMYLGEERINTILQEMERSQETRDISFDRSLLEQNLINENNSRWRENTKKRRQSLLKIISTLSCSGE